MSRNKENLFWVTRDEVTPANWSTGDDITVWRCPKRRLTLCDDGYWAHDNDNAYVFTTRHDTFIRAFGIKMKPGQIKRVRIAAEVEYEA